MNSSASPCQIAPAGLADLPPIAALAATVWRAHYPGIISAAQIEYMLARMYDLETLRAEVLTGGIRYHCARVEGELAGFSAFGPTITPGEFKLHKLYVHPAHQRRGIGRALIRNVEQLAANAGCRALILAVNKANHQAIAAYRQNGFIVRESVVVEIGGGFVMDDYVMAKPVG
ncbi:MAG TPA: GNAT family N-acetyltransferase [Methylomirabilota bacterium]|nr:GNAT family N-acetyltransferase [Methylomirabilota bacterium]